jgi:hypothetical protein
LAFSVVSTAIHPVPKTVAAMSASGFDVDAANIANPAA